LIEFFLDRIERFLNFSLKILLIFCQGELKVFFERFNISAQGTPCFNSFFNLLYLSIQFSRFSCVIPEIRAFGKLFFFSNLLFKRSCVKDAPIYRGFAF